jgi:membrane-associated phospholipid phosphatase
MYFFGRATGHPYLARTGALATEALLDATILTEVLKVSAQRMRPDDGTGDGSFFHHGSSFPSGHSSSSWAVATVIAYRYKQHPFIKYGAFAAAAAISMSRYSGRNHFPSDILIGGAIGYGIGRFVYGHR